MVAIAEGASVYGNVGREGLLGIEGLVKDDGANVGRGHTVDHLVEGRVHRHKEA